MAAPSAVVVGGGIGGLAAAIGLRKAGWRVQVLERSAAPGELGAGLALMPNALAALAELDVAHELRAIGRPMGFVGLRTDRGRWLLRAPATTVTRTPGLLVHRADLHRRLVAALPAGTLRTATTVTAVAPGSADAPAVVSCSDFRGRREVSVELVVAADGLRGTLRRGLWPAAPPPAYAGFTAWRGVTAGPVELDDVVQTWGGDGELVTLTRLVDGRGYWWASANVAEGTRFADDRAEALRRWAGWPAPVGAYLATTPAEAVLRHDAYQLPRPYPPFHRGRVVLLGDAAHAMTPDLGQGACLAIEDAVVLAAVLADPAGGPLAGRLARYDAARRPRTQRLAALSVRVGAPTRLTSPLARGVRNAVVRAVPARLALRAAERPHRWTPPTIHAGTSGVEGVPGRGRGQG
ncbi:2-polyprenyl-6-methoxyphenol hydroxylase [Amycolatopsis arida]|uniref:2-polyprenyl-6-methoxyphenol hydroxylase n=1 Tax=Amycolatopsis arida TaxID=587909 RepID=A0A1I6ATI9_9PSEU|nr:FAD-dependent monooxygenase [Amycolatopsis arida]TDX97532.1 2-polyprenyl-6-methoxyphenol hydroxylase-like FAD-dependent oxidoreductase [Amycolatopsis arida]SFQ71969.1 2-polyprenyl-6-methoxyphenol hydroxylase [Amycolatopsis arida]